MIQRPFLQLALALCLTTLAAGCTPETDEHAAPGDVASAEHEVVSAKEPAIEVAGNLRWERLELARHDETRRGYFAERRIDVYELSRIRLSTGDLEAVRTLGIAVGLDTNRGTIWAQEPGSNVVVTPAASISATAYAVGFQSIGAFTTAFRERCDETPSEYRARARGETSSS